MSASTPSSAAAAATKGELPPPPVNNEAMFRRIQIVSLGSTIGSDDRAIPEEAYPCFLDESKNILYRVTVPDEELTGCDVVDVLRDPDWRARVPKAGGVYFIVTDEPVLHCLHSGDRKIPRASDEMIGAVPGGPAFQVVYNGISDDLRARVADHLLRPDARGAPGSMSAISVDLHFHDASAARRGAGAAGGQDSHAKLAWAEGGGRRCKLPKMLALADGAEPRRYTRPVSREDALRRLHLSAAELERAARHGADDVLRFKNGIAVSAEKHSNYRWLFVFVVCQNHLMRGYLETRWRELHGVPLLCSYIKGR
jgi:hypothetical protein